MSVSKALREAPEKIEKVTQETLAGTTFKSNEQ